MKKLSLNKIFFWIFIVFWCAVTLVNYALPPKNFSENENRFLSDFPPLRMGEKSWWEDFALGTYMLKVEDYLNDHFIARDTWISMQSSLEYALGKRESNGVFIGKGALIEDMADPAEKYVKDNINGINHFAEKYGTKASVMIVPSSGVVQPDKLPNFAVMWDQNALIAESYAKMEGLRTIDLYEPLAAHADEYIFYRTDHHWTTYGAYLAACEFLAGKGVELPPKDAITEVTEGFNGTLYSRSGVRFIKSDEMYAFATDKITSCTINTGSETNVYDHAYFEEYLTEKDKYAYFLGKNMPVVTLETSAGTGKNLLMFKDSYAHCFAPILAGYYDTITLVDMRYISVNLDKFVDVSDYDEVLFLYNISTFTSQNDAGKLEFLS